MGCLQIVKVSSPNSQYFLNGRFVKKTGLALWRIPFFRKVHFSRDQRMSHTEVHLCLKNLTYKLHSKTVRDITSMTPICEKDTCQLLLVFLQRCCKDKKLILIFSPVKGSILTVFQSITTGAASEGFHFNCHCLKIPFLTSRCEQAF